MALPYEETPTLTGKSAEHFLERIEYWRTHPAQLHDIHIDMNKVDEAIKNLHIRRASRLKSNDKS